ncbi:methylmalonyl-CoA mutase family protein [Thermodesulfobacteriota bacterium]
MMKTEMSIEERYFEKPKRLRTASGYDLREIYEPEDIESTEYSRDIGRAGEYPYTRGIFSDMYRGRMWSLREICGYASPAETNRRIKYLLEEGESALNVIPDLPSQNGMDSDHPRALGGVGLQGIPWSSMQDMEIMMEGVPFEEVSMTMSVYIMPVLVFYLAAAEKAGASLKNIRGTILNDALSFPLVRFNNESMPQDVAVRMTTDTILFCDQFVPKFYPINIGSEGLRESGATAAQEIAFDFCLARYYIINALERGADIDRVARRVTFTARCGVDIFEEAAKFRAARRVWARMMKEEFGAKDPRTMSYKVHVVTKGSDLIPQQPENNIVRIAYQALASVLGGVQSLHTTSYDEPICLPTEESQRIAVRTQQILAYETGVVNVADPLGGSYYVEHLTNKLDEEITKIIDELKDNIAQYAWDGKLLTMMHENAVKEQREIEDGEKIVVGLNKFTVPEEAEKEINLHEISQDDVNEHLNNLKNLRESRDTEQVRTTLEELRKAAETKDTNTVPYVMKAAKAYATLGEIMGVMRMAFGHPYDAFGDLEYPF